MLIQLVDRSEDICDAWTTEFMDCEDVVIYCDDFFAPETDCVVSPANSFGFMEGGLDGVITRRLGMQVQENVQKAILGRPMKELLVGETIVVHTDNKEVPYCISAPTMRVPMDLRNTANVYLAAKAIFNCLKVMIEADLPISKVTISGLGTGVGQVEPEICANQMRMAYNEVWLGKSKFPNKFYEMKQHYNELFHTSI